MPNWVKTHDTLQYIYIATTTIKANMYYPHENKRKNLCFDLNVPYPVPVTSNLHFSGSSTQPLNFVTWYLKQK